MPARRTPIIGRERDVATVCDRLLHGEHRVVTLVGAAGTGKTTVALEVARQVEPLMSDGVWLV
ncbi:MAG: NB-ARC domain-containing protein, partial [Mycetocola sp.]